MFSPDCSRKGAQCSACYFLRSQLRCWSPSSCGDRVRAPALVLVLASVLAAGIRLDVPFVRQEKNGCGSAVLAMVIGSALLFGVMERMTDRSAEEIANESGNAPPFLVTLRESLGDNRFEELLALGRILPPEQVIRHTSPDPPSAR